MTLDIEAAKAVIANRFFSYVEKTETCWPWTGSLRVGYGAFALTHHLRVGAHRWSYEHFRGPIPDGLTIDHLCRNKRCVNPDHLEVVTRGENTRRANASITHCPQGHEYTPENTRVGFKNKRACRACERDRARRAQGMAT